MYYVMVLNIYELLVKDKHTSSKCSHEQLRYILRKIFFHIDNELTLWFNYRHFTLNIKSIWQIYVSYITCMLLKIFLRIMTWALTYFCYWSRTIGKYYNQSFIFLTNSLVHSLPIVVSFFDGPKHLSTELEIINEKDTIMKKGGHGNQCCRSIHIVHLYP